ncbi:hypothetical protein C7S14_5465 [Burkholderia cepacia]|nr:hypothetical protein C7S14_5465 [Burkholderia cepacia]
MTGGRIVGGRRRRGAGLGGGRSVWEFMGGIIMRPHVECF